MIYTLTLNPAVDYFMHLPGGLRPGQLNRSSDESVQFGGKGINVSRVLRTLGVDSVALGFVAGFTGQALQSALESAGLAQRFLTVSSGMTRINVKVSGAEETEINGTGPEITAGDMERLHAQLDELEPGDILVLSGSLPGCLRADAYGVILKRLAGRGIDTVVDTAGEALRSTLQYVPFLIKPNHLELGALFGKQLDADEEIIDCARELQRMGARNVLVSMAGEGALLLDEGGQVHRITAPRGRVISSIGAGDSMVAGFLAGWLQKGSYDEALMLGTAAGSATAFSMGLADGAMIRKVRASMSAGGNS